MPGDIPFTYDPDLRTSNVGVIRRVGQEYHWFFNVPGFVNDSGVPLLSLNFGLYGDNIIQGPWEKPGVTNPAVARLLFDYWFFFIYKSDNTVATYVWGGVGDIPKVQDYDGDGLFDIAVFRPTEFKTYVIESSTQDVKIYDFGTFTSELNVRGDYSGDGTDDITYWEPISGMFHTMKSDGGFDSVRTELKLEEYYYELPLGLYFTHLPLNWNYRNGQLLYTVVDHAHGLRFWRQENNPSNPPLYIQWGLEGDSLG